MGANRPLWAELFDYVKTSKKWWLVPLIVLFLLVILFILLAQSSIISPFVYALF